MYKPTFFQNIYFMCVYLHITYIYKVQVQIYNVNKNFILDVINLRLWIWQV